MAKIKYYTEYPTGEFFATDDVEAAKNPALVIYREPIGIEFDRLVVIRDEKKHERS